MTSDRGSKLSLGQKVALGLATLAAMALGLILAVPTIVLLSLADSGGLALPIEVSGAVGGALAGVIAATPAALRLRRKGTLLVGGGLGLLVGVVVVSFE